MALSLNDAIDLVNNILHENNPFKNIWTVGIWIEDDLFDDDDSQAVKDVSKTIIDTTNDIIDDTIQTEFPTVTTKDDYPTVTNILTDFPKITTLEDDFPTIADDNEDPIETKIIDNGMQILEEDVIAIDTGVPKKVKTMSSNANKIKSAVDKILNKCKKQKPIGTLKTKNRKAANWLRQAGWLHTDDQQTIDYNNVTNITDLDILETIDYNKETSVGDLIDSKKTSGRQLATKKLLKNTEI